MTDHKELMEQLRSWTSTPTEHEAADAIEALQADKEQNKIWRKNLSDTVVKLQAKVVQLKVDAFRDYATQQELRAEVERLKSDLEIATIGFNHHRVERETAEARLTALEGQEPVAWLCVGNEIRMKKPLNWRKEGAVPLFLAAGAAPTTQESCKHGTPYRYPCDVCDTPTLEQLIIKENDRVLQESLEGKYAMAQAAPTKEQT